jgi:hypothetical protein
MNPHALRVACHDRGAAGDNPFARLGGMALEDWMTGTFGDTMDGAMGGH